MEARNQPVKQMEKTIAFANQVRDLKAVLDKADADEGKNPAAAVSDYEAAMAIDGRIGKGQHGTYFKQKIGKLQIPLGAAGVLAGQVRAGLSGGAGGAEVRRRRRRHAQAARVEGQGADRQGRGRAEVEPGAGQELLAPGHQDGAVELAERTRAPISCSTPAATAARTKTRTRVRWRRWRRVAGSPRALAESETRIRIRSGSALRLS